MEKIVTTRTDDLDGRLADETIRFALDGVSYEIDLCESNASKLRQALQPYLMVGRRIKLPASVKGRTDRGSRAMGSQARAAEIRAWARKHGLPVRERGRIAAELLRAYDAGDPSSLHG
ncbi:Lsr2 family protein [Acrocarpospora sp. B8E8]|uniref:histone-like nucleoid-structuring protein Lsr2 n=1 Tax=Acrocarpospora sp. B8E8 TaxID=3153572 RepID=UPI00325D88A2